MADQPVDLQEPLDPRIVGRRGELDPQRVPALSTAILRRMHGRFRGAAGQPRASRSKGTTDVPAPVPLSRRSTVKARYVPLTLRGREAARLHLLYLERDGVEPDGSPGRFFGPTEEFRRAHFDRPIDGEKRQFRFIVSPEDAARLDLPDFTRRLMAQVEKDLGRRLLWAAVGHHDTDRPHVHVVIRGVDASGKELRIPRRYCFEEMRWRAQEIITRELGLRSDREVERQYRLEVGQDRLTTIDRRIAHLVRENGCVGIKELAGMKRLERAGVLGRLDTLERLRLAHRVGGGKWKLEDGWERALTKLGERGDIVKRLHQAVAGDVNRYRIADPERPAEPVEGVVRAKGLHDELTGEIFAAIETMAGETHYVRIDAAMADELAVGDIARVTTTAEPWIKPTDRAIVRVASSQGGVYDPERHRLELDAVRRSDAPISAAVLVAGNVRRLERLERYRLVERTGDGRWRIPADLLQQLAARERSHPRALTRVAKIAPSLAAQIGLPTSAWIDNIGDRGARAFSGFGAEVTRAIEQRREALRHRQHAREQSSANHREAKRSGPTREDL
jgi:type IV secretory pathway VirD2 relaxase